MVRISRQRLVGQQRRRVTPRAGRPSHGGFWGGSPATPRSVAALGGVLMVLGLCLGVFFLFMMMLSSGSDGSGSTATTAAAGPSSPQQSSSLLRPATVPRPSLFGDSPHRNPHADQYDALATDLWTYLDCGALMAVTTYNDNSNNNNEMQQQTDDQVARRLEEEPLGDENENKNNYNAMDDDHLGWRGMDDEFRTDDVTATAQHLLCLAAAIETKDNAAAAASSPTTTNTLPTATLNTWQSRMHCPVVGSDLSTRLALLDLWDEARSHFEPHRDSDNSSEGDLLTKVLRMSLEEASQLVGRDVYLWDTLTDQGMDYVVRTMGHTNSSHTADQGGLYGLGNNLGPGKVFVDVGSGLGIVSMAVSLLYPRTRIVSIEVAPPNWLLQRLNWVCNAETLQATTHPEPLILLAGVGPDARHTSAGRFLWKPSLTTATRAWGPASERLPDDVELTVQLEAWHALASRAELTTTRPGQHGAIDVLYLDCGACEYNLVPALTDAEWDSISVVLGQMHWGYLPVGRLPSTARGRATHARLCTHENFARTAKECCDVPDLPVRASYPDQVLEVVQGNDDRGGGLAQPGTVADVAGDFCDDFAEWAVEKHLHDVPNDIGWFQLSPVAEGY